MSKKILFINAINFHVEVEKRHPPLGLGSLVSSVRKYFGKDCFEFKIIDRDVEKEIINFAPDIVGITSVSQNFNIAKGYAQIIKSKGVFVIVGGIHISMLPESLSDDMDVGVIGEAEETIVDLLKLYLNKKSFPVEDLNKIRGIIYRKDGKLIRTEKRELIDPLDKIPFPARDLFKIEKHAYIFTSRGCPYRCVFCASSRYWDKVRFFSAEYVVEEIKEMIYKHKVRLISFYDDLMMANIQRLKEIVRLLKQEDLLTRVKFTANARANILSEEMVRLLKEMNVVSVGMGLESGSPRVLHYLKGNSVDVKTNREAINLLKKYKIAANASFVIGSPDETMEEILETWSFIKTSKLDLVDTYVLTPFPGTPIWEYAKKRELVSNNMDWNKLNVSFVTNYEAAIILSEKLCRGQIYRLYLKFRRLSFYLAYKNILHHPLLMDMPKMLMNKIVEKRDLFIGKIFGVKKCS